MIDQFSADDLERWDAGTSAIQAFHDRVYFDLERQRVVHREALCAALRDSPGTPIVLDDWVRVTDWRWNLTPLSPAGSVIGIGGRFNLGQALDRARGQAFPALYLARDVETAYLEYFGADLTTTMGALTLGELALRRPSSFTTFVLRGCIENALDLHDARALTAFARIISKFSLSRDAERLRRKANLKPRPLIRTAAQLRQHALNSPSQWRAEPQQCGIPAPGQMLGDFARAAGFDAILYPSQRGGRACLAVFPSNLRASDSWIEVVGERPPGSSWYRLDGHHARDTTE